jgi:hypothetical protein
VAIAEWRSPKANCGPTTTLYPSGAALVKSASRGLRDGVAVPLIAHYWEEPDSPWVEMTEAKLGLKITEITALFVYKAHRIFANQMC